MSKVIISKLLGLAKFITIQGAIFPSLRHIYITSIETKKKNNSDLEKNLDLKFYINLTQMKS